jgi:glucose/arabinose dehydrogenase
MKKKNKILIFSVTIIFIITFFVSFWSFIDGGYDKQNKFILGLKKIIPRKLAVKIRDTIFIIPELKYQNNLLQLQVDKYEQGLEGKIFREKKISSLNGKEFKYEEFFLPFKQLDIKAGWNKLSNTFRAHYLEIVKDKVIVLSGEGKIISFEKTNINKEKLNQKAIKTNLKKLSSDNNFKFFGVRDILFDQDKIYISMILENEKGFTMNVYVSDYNLDYLDFSIFFEKGEYTKKYTIQSGGRLEKFKDNKILLSLGTAEIIKKRAQDDKYLEGKIISIDKNTKKFEILSKGHRNPQGLLYISKNDLIINSEHGPKGGDEVNLNFLKKTNKISNFGWPVASYGIEYDGTDPYKKSHSNFGFIEPFKNFTPSVGISEVLFLPKSSTRKENYLIVSSLRASSIYLLTINDNFTKILNEDRIFFSDQRIRDIEYDYKLKKIIMIFETTPSIATIDLG